MAIDEKLLERAQNNPSDLRFDEACQLAKQLGWEDPRKKGSHLIFSHPKGYQIRKTFPQPLNLQEGQNGRAKEYQVKQMLKMAYELGIIKSSIREEKR